MRAKQVFLQVLNHTANPITRRIARSGRGPFSLILHTGRTSGRAYETPVMLTRSGGFFIVELTYGTEANWYRNIVAAGECDVLAGGRRFHIDRIDEIDTSAGYRAFGPAKTLLLRALRRREFRALHISRSIR